MTHKYNLDEVIEDMDKNQISLRVISTLEGNSIKEQNDHIVRFVKQFPNRFIGCGVINPKERNSIDEVKRIVKNKEIIAIEFNSYEHGYLPEFWEDRIISILDIISSRNLIVKIFVGAGPRTMPQQWKKYIDRYPNLSFVFLHMGGKDFGYGSLPFVLNYKNCFYESSEMCEMPTIRKIFKEMPIERIVFGSNFPNQFTECSIILYDNFKLYESEYGKFMKNNAERLIESVR